MHKLTVLSLPPEKATTASKPALARFVSTKTCSVRQIGIQLINSWHTPRTYCTDLVIDIIWGSELSKGSYCMYWVMISGFFCVYDGFDDVFRVPDSAAKTVILFQGRHLGNRRGVIFSQEFGQQFAGKWTNPRFHKSWLPSSWIWSGQTLGFLQIDDTQERITELSVQDIWSKVSLRYSSADGSSCRIIVMEFRHVRSILNLNHESSVNRNDHHIINVFAPDSLRLT